MPHRSTYFFSTYIRFKIQIRFNNTRPIILKYDQIIELDKKMSTRTKSDTKLDKTDEPNSVKTENMKIIYAIYRIL